MPKLEQHAARRWAQAGNCLAGALLCTVALTGCGGDASTAAEAASGEADPSTAVSGAVKSGNRDYIHRNWDQASTHDGSVTLSFVDEYEHESDYELLPKHIGQQLKGIPVYIDEDGVAIDVAPEDPQPEDVEFFEAREPREEVGEDGDVVVFSDEPPE